MSRITARNGNTTLCIEKKGRCIRFFLNGVENEGLKNLFGILPSEPMGGTYHPKPGSMLACYNALTNSPLSKLYDSVEVEGNIGTIPHVSKGGDVVY